jgi:integrase
MPAAVRKIALTDRSMKALRADPGGKRLVVWDALMPGMAVRVSALGKRSFYVVKRRMGDAQPTWHLLGAYPVMSLSKARAAAREALGALIAGEHPKRLAEEKRRAAEVSAREKVVNTFASVAEAFIRHYLRRLKPRTARIYEAYIRREMIPILGARPVVEIRRRDIIALVEGVAERSGKGSALNMLTVLRKLLGWALGRDLPGFEANPAASVRVADLLGASKARDRLLTDAEIAMIWRACPAAGASFATIYRLLLLLGLRLNEIAHARWEDLDLDAATLTVPPEHSKNGEAMLVPLPPLAVELFATVPRFSGPYIFTTTAGARPVQHPSTAKARLDAALRAHGAGIAPFVVHDFRRCVRSGLGRLGVPAVVAEMCLGHRQPGIVGVYDRHSYFNEKRSALMRWQAHLLGIIDPLAGDGEKVVALPVRVPA